MNDTVDKRYSHIIYEPEKGPADARVLGTGMHVWEIVWAARNYDNLDVMAESLNLERALLEEGVCYAAEYSAEVEAAIAENDAWTFQRLQEVLPAIQPFSPVIDAVDDDR